VTNVDPSLTGATVDVGTPHRHSIRGARGTIKGGWFEEDSDGAAIAAGGTSADMTVTVALKGGNRFVSVHVHGQFVPAATAGFYFLTLLYDGVQKGVLWMGPPSTSVLVDSTVTWRQAADDASATLAVGNSAASSGTITPIAQADNTRFLRVFDDGVDT